MITPTPRTDAAACPTNDDPGDTTMDAYLRLLDCSRTLERELAHAREALRTSAPAAMGSKLAELERLRAIERDYKETWALTGPVLTDALVSAVGHIVSERDTLRARLTEQDAELQRLKGQLELIDKVADTRWDMLVELRAQRDATIAALELMVGVNDADERLRLLASAKHGAQPVDHATAQYPQLTPAGFRLMQSELTALREDRARLESIRHLWRFGCEEGAAGHPDRWYIFTTDWSCPIGEGETLRAAIDAARKIGGAL